LRRKSLSLHLRNLLLEPLPVLRKKIPGKERSPSQGLVEKEKPCETFAGGGGKKNAAIKGEETATLSGEIPLSGPRNKNLGVTEIDTGAEKEILVGPKKGKHHYVKGSSWEQEAGRKKRGGGRSSPKPER